MMKLSESIRVRIESRYRSLYNDLCEHVFGEAHEVFFFCVCVGSNINKREPLKKPEDKFWSRTITPEEYAFYYCILLKESQYDASVLLDDKSMIHAMEEYANAGMASLLSGILQDFVTKAKDQPQIDRPVAKDLAKILLGHIHEKVEGKAR